MTPGDIVRAQVDHRETAIVPYTIDFEEGIDLELDSYFGDATWRANIVSFIERYAAVETMRKTPTMRSGYEKDPYGTIWRTDRRPFHLESPGLTNASFQGYTWPDPEEFFIDSQTLDESARTVTISRGDVYTLAGIGWGLFETSWGIRGFENALADSASEPSFYADLLDRITEHFLAYLDFTLESLPDVDGVMFGDDWGYQQGVILGPDRWREFLKPRWRKIYAAVHARGKKVFSHCCGSIIDIMDDVVEIGLDVLESVQPEARGMNPYDLKSRWGDKLAFWGGFGSQSTIQFGTPDEIEREVDELRVKMAAGGGYILAPAKGLQPGTPIENAAAVVKAFTKPQTPSKSQ